jgi:hypothetical protein
MSKGEITKMKNRKYFNLIEVTLAMGIAVIAIVILTGMLPAGLKNSRNAVAYDLSSNLLNGFADFYLQDENITTDPTWVQPTINTTKADYAAEGYYEEEIFGDEIITIHDSNPEPQIFRAVTPIYDSNGVALALAVDLKDLDGEIRVWVETTTAVHSDPQGGSNETDLSNRRTDRNGTAYDPTANVVNVIFELSWPLEKAYDKRQTTQIKRDITNL